MLTGKIGVRFGLFGKLIVQVEHDRLAHPPGHAGMFWEDASINELLRAMRISGQFCNLSDAALNTSGEPK